MVRISAAFMMENIEKACYNNKNDYEVMVIKLFIIGNGFDRAHRLPTSYWDFRAYLETHYWEFLHAFEEHYDIYPESDEDAKKQILWNELESNLANIDEDDIIAQGVDIDMDLESGDVGIEDTLYSYFSEEYGYINELAKYLKQWVRTIRIRDVEPQTTHIKATNGDYYITFNYTAVLETAYKIRPSSVLHIHGSLHQYEDDPILGHGNAERIEKVKKNREEAQSLFDEKWSSICRAVEDYYNSTYKQISRYTHKLSRLFEMSIDEVIVVGHSLAGVDLPYFSEIDRLTGNHAHWEIYYYSSTEESRMKNSLIEYGVDEDRINMVQSDQFFNL